MNAFGVYHCGGLLASMIMTKDFTRFVVWNPYWGQSRWIEPRTRHIPDMYAIGYETRNSCRSYKLLSCVDSIAGSPLEYEVYELESNSWRVLNVTSDWATDVYRYGGVSVNGNTYWYTPKGSMGEYVICFDFTTERFGPALPLPFRSRSRDVVVLSSVREEQLTVLFVHWYIFKMEIWITNTIEPNDVSWRKLHVAVDMEPFIGLMSKPTTRWSFFVDEEIKAAMLFDTDKKKLKTTRNRAYIIGENGYFRSVDLGESAHRYCLPLGCSSYVPSSVQIKQLSKGKSS